MTERLTRVQQQERTRERLLDSAESLFGDRGIHQTSLDEIAAAAGLTKGAIYANFGGKKDLIAAILERKLTDEDDEPRPPHASLTGWVRELGDSYETAVGTAEVQRFGLAFVELWLYGMRNDDGREAVRQWLRTVRERNAAEAAARAGDHPPMPVDRLAVLMTALDVGVAFQHFIDPEAVPPDLYTAGLDAIMGS